MSICLFKVVRLKNGPSGVKYQSISPQANNRLAKRGGRTMAITPRHYLDFINHYANLFNEKRSELEEQQMHLNVGLRKIKETVDQVRNV